MVSCGTQASIFNYFRYRKIMNAVKLYVATARMVLENDQFDYSLCKTINSSFANLELSLTCTVCRGILSEPHSPLDTTCQHHVCQNCVGGRKKLKPSCSWCKDYTKYFKNTQLKCLLACYKGLCQYVNCTNLLVQFADLNSYADPEKRLINIINRGAQLPPCHARETKLKIDLYSSFSPRHDSEMKYRYRRYNNLNNNDHRDILTNSSEDESCVMDFSKVKVERHSPELEKLPRIDPDKTETHLLRLRRVNSSAEDSTASDVDSQPLYSVAFASTRSKLILKRRNIPLRRETKHSTDEGQLPAVSYSLRTPDYVQSRHSPNDRNDRTRFRKSKHKSSLPGRPACRCGTAATRPGKLTCCGQRCACYMQKKACSTCRCRGCRNPHLIDGVKVLGKFLRSNDHSDTKIIASNSSPFLNAGSNCLNKVIPNLSSNSIMDLS